MEKGKVSDLAIGAQVISGRLKVDGLAGLLPQERLEALTKAGLWEELQPKLIMGESVRQVLDYVSRGEVDAGFVFATDAAIAKGKVKIVTAVQGHQPIVYPVALVAAGQKQALAQEFLNFLFAPESGALLSKYGFGKP